MIHELQYVLLERTLTGVRPEKSVRWGFSYFPPRLGKNAAGFSRVYRPLAKDNRDNARCKRPEAHVKVKAGNFKKLLLALPELCLKKNSNNKTFPNV